MQLGKPPNRLAMNLLLRRLLSWLVVLALLAVGWWFAFRVLTSYRIPDVPFVTTPPEVVDAMIDLADLKPQDIVYDLGCGDGRLILAAAQRQNIRGIGIDIDPERVAEAREAIREAGLSDRVRILRNDLFRESFRDGNAVLMFLNPSVLERLLPEFEQLRPGSRIVSHHYRIPTIRPEKTLQVNDSTGLEHPVHLYITPLKRE